MARNKAETTKIDADEVVTAEVLFPEVVEPVPVLVEDPVPVETEVDPVPVEVAEARVDDPVEEEDPVVMTVELDVTVTLQFPPVTPL